MASARRCGCRASPAAVLATSSRSLAVMGLGAIGWTDIFLFVSHSLPSGTHTSPRYVFRTRSSSSSSAPEPLSVTTPVSST
jgi:hypothetical protein